MTFATLTARNLMRNKFRMVLTVLGVAVAIVAFLLLRTVVSAWASGAELADKNRVVTRNSNTFVMPLPKRYVEEVAALPHVKALTWANWFGGKDPMHDREFFKALAVDANTYFTVYDDMQVPTEVLETWKQDRRGAIIGDILAKRLGWKVGDKVTLKSGIYPGNWQFTIDGIYATTSKSLDRSTFIFHWNYLNESLSARRRDQVGWVVSRIDDPSQIATISAAIDKHFDDMDTSTLSQDERTFNVSFLAMFSALLGAMDIVSAVILLIMTLILGNTIAMGVRERTAEYGMLRALGFLPRHVALWILGEALLMGLVGGALGVAFARPFINKGMGRFVEENLGSLFPSFRLETANIVLGLVAAMALAAAAAAIPALRSSKLRVVDSMRRVA